MAMLSLRLSHNVRYEGGKKDKRATADVALQDFVYLTQAGFAVGFRLQVYFLFQHAHIVVVPAADCNTTSKFYCLAETIQ